MDGEDENRASCERTHCGFELPSRSYFILRKNRFVSFVISFHSDACNHSRYARILIDENKWAPLIALHGTTSFRSVKVTMKVTNILTHTQSSFVFLRNKNVALELERKNCATILIEILSSFQLIRSSFEIVRNVYDFGFSFFPNNFDCLFWFVDEFLAQKQEKKMSATNIPNKF